jgi:hypothetical protein
VARFRGITGCFWRSETEYSLFDLKGYSSTGLKEFSESLGIPMDNKDQLDLYKSSMHKAILNPCKEVREMFFRYSIEDAEVLLPLHDRFISSLESICRNELNLPEDKIPKGKQWRRSLGSCVALIFELFMIVNAEVTEGTDPQTFQKALFKVGYLGSLNQRSFLSFNRRKAENERKEIFMGGNQNTALLARHLSRLNYSFDAINLCSINFLQSFDKKVKINASM